jgi:prepilin-type N-terminal cleavage/methylation domain-containing protein
MTMRGTAGFSLVETMVALAIIAVMSGLLFETVGTSALFGQGLARRREAILLARSLLDQAAIPPESGQRGDTGEWRGLTWHVVRRGLQAGARASGPPIELVRIDIEERATGRRLVGVQTLRLKR